MKEQERKNIDNLLTLINEYTHKLIGPEGAPELIVKDILKGHVRDFYEQIDRLALFVPPLSPDDDQEPDTEEAPAAASQEAATTEPASVSEGHQKEQESIDEMKKSLESLRKQFEKMEPSQPETQDSRPEEQNANIEPHQEYPEQEASASEEPIEENQPAEKEKPVEEKATPKEKSSQALSPDQPSQKKVIGEQFKDDKNSLNDFLSLKNGNHSIGERLKHHQIHDLKKAIDINHKFLFISELFNGNSQEYNQTIERLNAAGSIEEAAAILDEFRGKHNWNEKEEALNIFNELIHRKF